LTFVECDGTVTKFVALEPFHTVGRLLDHLVNKGEFFMKKIAFALVGAASLALAACGGKGDDSLAENVQENYDNAADNLDAMADNTANAAESDVLENQADALRAEGDRKEDAIDDADVNAAATTPAQVNAM